MPILCCLISESILQRDIEETTQVVNRRAIN